MPVIVLASPKGGVGKSTCAVILATEFARLGAKVTVMDCDPNRSLTRWSNKGMPKDIKLLNEIDRSNIISKIRSSDGDGKVVIVDLEGIASQIVSRAISQADLVIVPMQPTALDSDVGSEALALVHEEEETLGREIKHAVALTKTSAAIITRAQKELEEQLQNSGIDLIQPYLVARTAFAELFACGGDLHSMQNDPSIVTGGKIDKAIENARAFTEAVYERLDKR